MKDVIFLKAPLSFIMPSTMVQTQTEFSSVVSTQIDWPMAILYLALYVFTFYLIGSFLGKLKQKLNLKIHLTRKLFCMMIFISGFILPQIISTQNFPHYFPLLSSVMTIFLILSLSSKIRLFFLPSTLTFEAINREGEENETLKRLWTETLFTSILVFIAGYFFSPSFQIYLFYPALVSGLSDSAAEIVGGYWGKKKYQTLKLWGGGTHYRTIEGSFAFFIVSVLISGLISFYVPHGESVVLTLTLLPILLTLTEAYAPHSWDNPFIFLTSYLTIAIIHH
jgi:phytol kinase